MGNYRYRKYRSWLGYIPCFLVFLYLLPFWMDCLHMVSVLVSNNKALEWDMQHGFVYPAGDVKQVADGYSVHVKVPDITLEDIQYGDILVTLEQDGAGLLARVDGNAYCLPEWDGVFVTEEGLLCGDQDVKEPVSLSITEQGYQYQFGDSSYTSPDCKNVSIYEKDGKMYGVVHLDYYHILSTLAIQPVSLRGINGLYYVESGALVSGISDDFFGNFIYKSKVMNVLVSSFILYYMVDLAEKRGYTRNQTLLYKLSLVGLGLAVITFIVLVMWLR